MEGFVDEHQGQNDFGWFLTPSSNLKMAQPSARIRRIVAADDKEVRFVIGKATMEPLTTANRLGESMSHSPRCKNLSFHPQLAHIP
jgi:hypothetical protein